MIERYFVMILSWRDEFITFNITYYDLQLDSVLLLLMITLLCFG